MIITGIIAEYNPFHNGHAWQARAARAAGADAVIAVMSGHFVQRGEPALIDKWRRAAAAVASEVDLVLELPVAFSVRSAQAFAAGGVRLLAAAGVQRLSFGTETDQTDLLEQAAAWLDNPAIAAATRQYLSQGRQYANALATATAQASGVPAEILISPNNILALEYLRAIRKYAPHLKPIPVRRQQAGYHDQTLTPPFASASAIRAALRQDCPLAELAEVVPSSAISALMPLGHSAYSGGWETLDGLLLGLLRRMGNDEMHNILDVSEGLENKILSAARRAASLEEFWPLIKSKRYPLTRLQRIMVHVLLGMTAADGTAFDIAGPQYLRVLAFNNTGRVLLRSLRQASPLPVVIRAADRLNSSMLCQGNLSVADKMLAFDCLATDLFCLTCQGPDRSGGKDFLTSPVYLPKPV